MARPKKQETEAAKATQQGEAKPQAPAAVQPAPAHKASQAFQPPAAIPVTMEPGKIQLQAIIAKEKSEWPTPDQVTEALRTQVNRGLQIIQLTETYWHFRIGTKEASGNLKMPLSQIVMQANVLLTPTRAPTEE